ncbi:hypothetical protein [Paraferrimonas sp. SM1919]|uniref:hypothetical protein n=1 Tax=Paraferrimonas sp. SM1919 TaxID=2662263 RepID=UPI0013D31885|nr:hypothetical protein [Paraferrimonas sp. SM1919]
MKKFSLTALAVVIATTCFDSVAVEDGFSVPGTRAMGLSGAAVANVVDSSAIWYNPAALGLVGDYADLTVEYGDFISADLAGNSSEISLYSTKQDIKYAAFSYKGFGIAYFKPYQWGQQVSHNGDLIRVKSDYKELKLSYGFGLTDNIYLGAGIDLINIDDEFVQSFTSLAEHADANGARTGYGYAVAALGNWRFLETSKHPVTIKAGVNFRSSTQGLESDSKEQADAVNQDTLASRPESMSYGVSAGLPLIQSDISVNLNFSAHFEKLKYGLLEFGGAEIRNNSLYPVSEYLAPEYDKQAFGLEVDVTPSSDVFGLTLRAGSSKTDLTNGNIRLIPSNGYESQSVGAGLSFSNILLDVAMEKRNILANPLITNFSDEEETMSSASVSIVW